MGIWVCRGLPGHLGLPGPAGPSRACRGLPSGRARARQTRMPPPAGPGRARGAGAGRLGWDDRGQSHDRRSHDDAPLRWQHPRTWPHRPCAAVRARRPVCRRRPRARRRAGAPGAADAPDRLRHGSLTRAASDPQARAGAVELLRRAFELGIRHFDTAHFYGDGRANALLAGALGDRREEILLATKAGAVSTPDGPFPMALAQHPSDLRRSIEQNLETLRTDRLDLVYLRRADQGPGLLSPEDQQVPLAAQLEVLSGLRAEGVIGGIGLSHVSLDQLREALPAGIVAVQNIFNLADQGDSDLLRLCEREGIAWVPYFPLGGGFGNLPRVVELPVVQEIAEELGATAMQVGQAWLLAVSPRSVFISGTSSVHHLEQNLAAGDLQLTPAHIQRLEDGARAAGGSGA